MTASASGSVQTSGVTVDQFLDPAIQGRGAASVGAASLGGGDSVVSWPSVDPGAGVGRAELKGGERTVMAVARRQGDSAGDAAVIALLIGWVVYGRQVDRIDDAPKRPLGTAGRNNKMALRALCRAA